MTTLEELLEKEKQLKARIQKAKARLDAKDRKERTGRLISWGVAIEQILKDEDEAMTFEQWAFMCKKHLSGRTLERAMTGPMSEFLDPPEPSAQDNTPKKEKADN